MQSTKEHAQIGKMFGMPEVLVKLYLAQLNGEKIDPHEVDLSSVPPEDIAMYLLKMKPSQVELRREMIHQVGLKLKDLDQSVLLQLWLNFDDLRFQIESLFDSITILKTMTIRVLVTIYCYSQNFALKSKIISVMVDILDEKKYDSWTLADVYSLFLMKDLWWVRLDKYVKIRDLFKRLPYHFRLSIFSKLPCMKIGYSLELSLQSSLERDPIEPVCVLPDSIPVGVERDNQELRQVATVLSQSWTAELDQEERTDEWNIVFDRLVKIINKSRTPGLAMLYCELVSVKDWKKRLKNPGANDLFPSVFMTVRDELWSANGELLFDDSALNLAELLQLYDHPFPYQEKDRLLVDVLGQIKEIVYSRIDQAELCELALLMHDENLHKCHGAAVARDRLISALQEVDQSSEILDAFLQWTAPFEAPKE